MLLFVSAQNPQNQTTKIRTRKPSRSLGKLKESLDNLSTQSLSLAALSPSTLVVGKISASMAYAWTKVSCLWLHTPTFLLPLLHQDILMWIPFDPNTQLISFVDDTLKVLARCVWSHSRALSLTDLGGWGVGVGTGCGL